ncbi:MAG: ATP-binding protein [Pseudomonadota bacterium]
MEIHRRRVNGEDAPDVYESKALCKDGTTKDIEISAEVIRYSGRQGVLGIVRDISDRKKREEEILRSQKLESVGLLAGGIAHDFNNLLTAILGNVSLAKIRQRLELETHELLNAAERSAIRAKHLTSQLLTFAKGGAPVRRIASVPSLIQDLAGFAVRGSNVRCEFNMSEDLWTVNVDEGQIGQVVNNVVMNAQQAMPDGGTIEISAENIIIGEGEMFPLDAGRYIRVSIEDHGSGIPPEHLEKIFDPYFTTKQEGRGLGLAVCHSIVKKHGGKIDVESTMGKGSTFRIYLPGVEEEAGKFPGILSAAGIDRQRSPAPGGGSVLLVDDEEAVRNIGGEILSYFGYKVHLVGDGREAVREYKKARETGDPFDAVILDLTMPGGLGGKETMKRLLEVDPKVKAIVSSGYSNDPAMCRFREHGFKGTIGKPYDIEEMRETIDRVIRNAECGIRNAE